MVKIKKNTLLLMMIIIINVKRNWLKIPELSLILMNMLIRICLCAFDSTEDYALVRGQMAKDHIVS